MASFTQQDARQALINMSGQFRGPGGAAAVLKDGQLVDSYTWGYANMDKGYRNNDGSPMKTTTPLPICSVSKQMLCVTLHSLDENPPSGGLGKGEFRKQVQLEIGKLLHPGIAKDTELTVDHLCDNQSGIRDYWALSVLYGARPEDRYSIADHNPSALNTLRSFHFEPGNGYSYANTNFNILARLIERVTGRDIADLIAERVFEPAGMETAKLIPDTAKRPGNGTGYEGDEQRGFYPAENNIEWAGDAGIVCTLEDMIAYEKYFDHHWTTSSTWAQSAGTPTPFKSGPKSGYRMGLVHGSVGDVPVVGHSGGLRGYKLNRIYAPSHRVSVVVMFNHMSNAITASELVLKTLLRLPAPLTPALVASTPGWAGAYLDEASGLAVVVIPSDAVIKISMVGTWEIVPLTSPDTAGSTGVRLRLDADTLHIERPLSNFTAAARRLAKLMGGPEDQASSDVVGVYYCDEVGSTLAVHGEGNMLYAWFQGFMGDGPPHLMRHLGENVWLMACPRSLDSPAPGDWTMVFNRDGGTQAVGVTVGCWIARKLLFTRQKNVS